MEPIVIDHTLPRHRIRINKRNVVETDPTRPNVVQMKTRILRPSEFEAIRSVASPSYRALFDVALLTGMRVVELRLFLQNPTWYDGKFIHLPRVAISKKRTTIKQRWVHLSTRGRALVDNINQLVRGDQIPTETALIGYLKRCAARAGINTTGLNMKMFRKTWESWLISYYPDRKEEIFLSQGHTDLTALRHYVNLPFTDVDRAGMKEWTEGWR